MMMKLAVFILVSIISLEAHSHVTHSPKSDMKDRVSIMRSIVSLKNHNFDARCLGVNTVVSVPTFLLQDTVAEPGQVGIGVIIEAESNENKKVLNITPCTPGKIKRVVFNAPSYQGRRKWRCSKNGGKIVLDYLVQ
jgi:hypothetical protein